MARAIVIRERAIDIHMRLKLWEVCEHREHCGEELGNQISTSPPTSCVT